MINCSCAGFCEGPIPSVNRSPPPAVGVSPMVICSGAAAFSATLMTISGAGGPLVGAGAGEELLAEVDLGAGWVLLDKFTSMVMPPRSAPGAMFRISAGNGAGGLVLTGAGGAPVVKGAGDGVVAGAVLVVGAGLVV